MKTGWAVIALVMTGCGSPDGESLSCGPGTVEKGGQCVSVASGDAGVDVQQEGGGGAGGSTPEQAPCEKAGYCPTVEMVTITGWPDGVQVEPYEIDSRETTNEEYALFLEDVKNGFTPGPVGEDCAANVSFAQDEHCLDLQKKLGTSTVWPVREPAFPAICTTWCDAASYCAWAGKRLCRTQPDDGTDGVAEDNEWRNACCGATTRSGCWDAEQMDCPWDAPCEYPEGLFNVAGGVREWVDYCYDGTGDHAGERYCLMGGSGLGERSGCGDHWAGDNDWSWGVGIRCCR